MATAAVGVDPKTAKPKTKSTLAYGALIAFSFLYFARPEDVIPGLSVIPVAKITGGIALLGLIATLAGGRQKLKFAPEIKVLLLLFVQLALCIPFAFWRSNSFSQVFTKFSKVVIVALLVAMVVTSLDQLRKLVFVQAAAVCAMTFITVIIHPGGIRLQGLLGGVFENPNDLAINIAINFPLCLAFFLAARRGISKVLWPIGLLGMMYAVMVTYSRSGIIAMFVAALICLWEFGVRGKRFHLLMLAGILGVVGLGVGIVTPHFVTRMKSLVQGNIEGSGDRGSLEARETLLHDSISLTLHHPFFGVGPGNFPSATMSWRVAHNTYTELSAEAGIPGLFLFLLFIALAFANLRKIRKTRGYAENKDVQLFTSAMWAALAAYLVGALFSSTEYQMFPYFMVAYTTALYRIANTEKVVVPVEAPSKPAVGGREVQRSKREEFLLNR